MYVRKKRFKEQSFKNLLVISVKIKYKLCSLYCFKRGLNTLLLKINFDIFCIQLKYTLF